MFVADVRQFIIYSMFSVVFVLFLGGFIAGCGSDSSDSGPNSNVVKTLPPATGDRIVQANIELPEGSPLQGESLAIEVYSETYMAEPDQAVALNGEEIKTDTATDAYLMLPQRENDSWPTVYLFSTILPGEEDTSLSAEGTAIALIMQAIPQELLLYAGEPVMVKQTIKENSEAFISRFQLMIEAEPYFLHLDNLSNVHDETYLAGVQNSLNGLKALVEDKSVKQISSVSLYRQANNAANYEVPEDMDLHVMPPQSMESAIYLKPIKEAGHVTGKISIVNDSSLYGLATATDLVTGEEISPPLPAPLIDLVFDKRLVPPQQSFWGFYIANESILDVQHRDVIVDVTTGALKGLSHEQYIKGVTPVLQLRTIYSKLILPTIDTVLDIGAVNYREAFGVMYNAGLFDNALPSLYRGDIGEGMSVIFKGLTAWPNPMLNELASVVGTRLYSSATVKLGLKMASVKATLFIWVYDMTAVFNDALLLPANVVSTVNFPVDLVSMTPKAIGRRNSDTIIAEVITLNGFGLKTLQHIQGGKIPTVNVVPKDNKGETIDASQPFKPFGLWPPSGFSDYGTKIEFSIPGEWLTENSKVETIEVSINHHYTERDVLGNNELRKVTLPLESNRNNFTIQIGGLMITSLNKSKIQGNDELVLNVSGLSNNKNAYAVNFKTRSGGVVEATIKTLSNNVLTLVVPHYDSMEVGPVSVYIENELGVKSNEAELTFIPEKVEFLSNEINEYGELELGITQPQGLPDIYYILNGIPPEYNYSAPITIPELTTVKAYAEKQVDGVSYFSDEAEFTYWNESSCNRVCDSPIISDTVELAGTGGLHTLSMTFEKNFKFCTQEIDNPESPTGKVTMLFFYTWDGGRTAADWDEIKNSNGGVLPYYGPSLSTSSNYNMGALSVTGPHTGANAYLARGASVDRWGDKTYLTPEISFAMIVNNFGSPEDYGDNDYGYTIGDGDYLRVKIFNYVGDLRDTYTTVINPEFLTESGCYKGDY